MTARRILKYLLVVIWMVVIFVFSSQGHEVSSGQSSEVMSGIYHVTGWLLPEMIVRKLAHIFLYLTLGCLIANLVWEYTKHAKQLIITSTLLALLYACSDELHQLFVPGRTGMIMDILIDTAAAFVGVAIIVCIHLQRHADIAK